MATKSILVLHGPNLNLLGEREPQHYGKQTLEDIDQALKTLAASKSIKLETMQSNNEGDLVNKIQSLRKDKVDFLIINPAAYTHTSVAMRDALSAVKVPFIEVHLSNVYAREPFRHHSYFSDIAVAVISGLGADGYIAALNFAINA
ncbi:MAG TPA: type II 3-dehydroquinate dehydratase [Methylophilaceae bacterium]|jgi:3-dehydroquinate dehydratase-2|nr:type II 3-dehydroquinate dehydratase [Methylophilaceae bacterium]HAP04456.1 type II 3-dehydroquinate dehydratase [Methylophilaceae bacterium]